MFVLIRSENLAIRTGKLSFISILRIRIANFTEKMILFTSLKLFLTYVCSFIHFESNTWSTVLVVPVPLNYFFNLLRTLPTSIITCLLKFLFFVDFKDFLRSHKCLKIVSKILVG